MRRLIDGSPTMSGPGGNTHALVADGAELRRISSNYQFTEGPVWHPRDECLLFSDIPAAQRLRYDGLACEVAIEPTMMANGMTLDGELNLIVCEHSTSTLSRFSGGVREVLASHFEGKELNSPNDVIVGDDGSIWFTDPIYGRMEGFGIARASELGFQGVYRIPPGGGALNLVVEPNLFSQPNGLCFSPDGTKIYINDTEQANIRLFDVCNGKLINMRVFAAGITDPHRPGAPDGMKCDAAGNIWCTGPNGIWIYGSDGVRIGEIAVPEFTANLHWGGKDWR
ncbi:MAG: SMP-30/gluconolactonase/LRE family protein, partial [Janthinobacterium lividum]